MKRLILILMLVPLLVACNKKMVFSLFEQDRQNYDLTEWIDGEEWVYEDNGKFWVGVTMNEDDYDGYYKAKMFILNKTDSTILFDPDSVSARLFNQVKLDPRGKLEYREVYTNDELQRRLKKQQNATMFLQGMATGLSSTDELPQNTAANYALAKMMEDDRRFKEIGYLKKTTLYPYKSIAGYMFLKKDVGEFMLLDIPVGGDVFSFQWMMQRK